MPRPFADRLSGAQTLVAVALFAALAWPAQAPGAKVAFEVHGTRGYKIAVEAAGGKVTLSAGGPGGVAEYEVPGRVTRHRVLARFGSRGVVDVGFRPGGRMTLETPPHRCEGRPRSTRWGAFVGTIRFRGERGFTRVRLRRASGSVRVHPRWRCGGRRRARSADRWASAAALDGLIRLDLIDRRHRLDGGVLALSVDGDPLLTIVSVEMGERRGRMRIKRGVLELGAGDGFSFDSSLSEATLSPPPPFAGRGVFERKPGGGGAWTGSLSVVLPGTKRFSLTAPRFRARLYRLGKDGIAKPGA